MARSTQFGFDTTAVRSGVGAADGCGALVTPLVQSTTYVKAAVDAEQMHAYSRVSNPTVCDLEQALGALENAPPSICFASGLAAETALFLAVLRAGDHAVCGRAVYGGTVRLLEQVLSSLGVSTTFVDATDVQQIETAITERTRLVFVETPANPTLELTDIRAAATAAHDAGALLAVDNTFLTPAIQQPLSLGADISVYSTTKHIEGHSTALGGALTTGNAALAERIRFIRKSTGAIQSPHNAWLTLRGLKTLPVRLRAHSANAQRIAERLAEHPLVRNVRYPGLPDFPQSELARAQHAGLGGAHGGVLAFEVAAGSPAAAQVLANVRLCSLVEHVGGLETFVTHPATMTHADVRPEHRRRVGITDGLIRLSVGLEDPEDVLADLEQAIERAHECAPLSDEGSPLCAATA